MSGRIRKSRLLTLAVAAAYGASACAQQDPATSSEPTPATQATTAQPTAVAGNIPAAPGTAAVTDFLTRTYGENAALTGEWNSVPVDSSLHAKQGEQPGDVVRNTCEHDEARYNGQPAVLVAVCGSMKDFGHPTPGATDFFLLQEQGGAVNVVARLHAQEFGSMGSAGEVDSEQFGADLPGFTVESGFTGQGHTVVTRTILLPKDGSFHEAGTFRSSMNDNLLREGCKDAANSAACAPGKSYDIEFDMDIDDSDATAAAYPIVIEEEGEACGRKLDATHRLVLDPATLTYAIPEALKREGC